MGGKIEKMTERGFEGSYLVVDIKYIKTLGVSICSEEKNTGGCGG